MSSLPRIIRAAVAGKRWLELFTIIVKSSPLHFLIRSDLGNLTMIRVSAGLHPISAISCLSETQKIRNSRMLTDITLIVMNLSHHVINTSTCQNVYLFLWSWPPVSQIAVIGMGAHPFLPSRMLHHSLVLKINIFQALINYFKQ